MRVVVTGAAGQVGREVVARFERPGHHDVLAADRTVIDLSQRDSILGVITSTKPDVVIHSGAFTAVDLCESQVDQAFGINALATRFVSEAARIAGARVVYISTDCVFDGNQDRPYDEWDEPNPQSVYGRSKLGGERELDSVDTIVRTSWVFGRHGSNMVKTVMRLIEEHSELAFVTDQRGCPTAAADLADAVYDLAIARIPGLFHVTNQGAVTWFEFVRRICESLGESPERVKPIVSADLEPPRPALRPANSVLDNAALRLTGIPQLPCYEDALERLIKELGK